MVGKTDIAGAALQELRRAQPNISLAWIAAKCRSNGKPTGSATWKASAARAWASA
jgi:hypothetical protein